MFLLLTCTTLYIQNVLSYTLVELCNSQSDSSLFKACIINIWSHTGRGVWWHDCGWRNNTSASGWFFINTPLPTCVARTTHWMPVTEENICLLFICSSSSWTGVSNIWRRRTRSEQSERWSCTRSLLLSGSSTPGCGCDVRAGLCFCHQRDKKKSTIPYSTCHTLATRCTQSPSA